MKMNDIEKLDDKGVVAKMDKLKRELFDMKMGSAVIAMKQPHLNKSLKRDIARLSALMHKRDTHGR